MSKIVDCRECGRRISLRQMPHGRFVAFDFQTDIPHHCSVASPASAAGWHSTGRRQIVPEPWLAFAQVLTTSEKATSALNPAPATSSRKDYSASRLALHANAQPGEAPAHRPKPEQGDWKSSRRQRVTELLAELPIHDFSDWVRPNTGWKSAVTSSVAVSPPRTMSLAERVMSDLDVWTTLGALDTACDLATGDLQTLVDDFGDDEVLELTAGLAHGTAIIDTDLTISCTMEQGVHLLGGEQPALVVNAPDCAVTLRNITLNADSRFGTILVLDGHLRLEQCVVSGRIGILLGPGAGSLEIVDSRIVCPMGGCGIVTASDSVVKPERVWIGAHHGIGILDLAHVGNAPETDGVTMVGDRAISMYVAISTS